MSYPEKKMVAEKKKENLGKVGYPEKTFNDDYWLYSDGNSPARIDKSAHQLINYFSSLFDDFIGERSFSILDIGAGAGNMVQQFRDKGFFKTEGCEYSESGRRIAKERFNIELENCDLRKGLPYENDQFDFSYCVGVLSMIPEDKMEKAISEIMRVTKYGFLLNIGTTVNDASSDRRGNPHHITAMNNVDYWNVINKQNGHDWTSIQPPQKAKFGIGVVNEFSGLFSKTAWPFTF
jgi:SAM-dependent methyltransferase